jgi:hypothetical protein
MIMKKTTSKGVKIIVGALCLASLAWFGSYYVKSTKNISHKKLKEEISVSNNRLGIDYLFYQLKEEIRKDPSGKKSYLDSILNFSLEVKEENNLSYQPKTVELLFDIVKRELRDSQDMTYVERLWSYFPTERKEKVVREYFETLPFKGKWDILKPVIVYKLKEGSKQLIGDFKEMLGDIKNGGYESKYTQNNQDEIGNNMKEKLQVLKKSLLGDN